MIDLASKLDLDTIRVPLTRFLLLQATNGQRTGKQWTVSEIATRLGAGHGAIRRSLQSLDREGLIRLERGRLVVTDCAAASGQLEGPESKESC
jgi:predicted transcriptional regulator